MIYYNLGPDIEAIVMMIAHNNIHDMAINEDGSKLALALECCKFVVDNVNEIQAVKQLVHDTEVMSCPHSIKW